MIGNAVLNRCLIVYIKPKIINGIVAHQSRTSGNDINCRKFVISHGKGASIKYANPTGMALKAPSVVETSMSSPYPEDADRAWSKRLRCKVSRLPYRSKSSD